MFSRTVSVRWVASTPAQSTTVQPRASASSRSASSIHSAGRPKVGSVVRSPAIAGTWPEGSIARCSGGRSRPRPASISFTRRM